MREAARALRIWNVPVEMYFRDVNVTRQQESVPREPRRAIEGPSVEADYSAIAMEQPESGFGYETPADDAALAQLVDEYIEERNGTTGANGNDVGDEVEESQEVENDGLQSNEGVPSFNFGATESIFGAQTSPDPMLAGSSGSSQFKWQSDFDFGAATPFNAGSGSSPSRSENFGVGKNEEREEEGRAKKTKVGSTSEGAADAESSSSSSDAKKEEAKKSTFDKAFSIDASCFSTKNKDSLGSFTRDPQDTSDAPKSTSAAGFDFPGSAAAKGKGKQKEERAAIFGTGNSTQFSFEPEGFTPTVGGFNGGSADAVTDPANPSHAQDKEKGKGKQKKEESTEKAVRASIFSAEDIAKFDSPPASGKTAEVGRFTFGTASAADFRNDASSSSSSVFTFGQSATSTEQEPVENGDEMPSQKYCCPYHENDHECLYTVEEGFLPPDKRPKAIEQAGVGSVSATISADTNAVESTFSETEQGLIGAVTVSAGPDSSHLAQVSAANFEQDSSDPDDGLRVNTLPVGVPSIIITPASESEVSVERENSDIFGKLGVDVAALRRIVNSVRPAAIGPQDLSMSLIAPGSSMARQVGESWIGRNGWQGRGRTAEEILAGMKLGYWETAQPLTASSEWREPEWPAKLPLEAPQSGSSADLPNLAAMRIKATITESPAASTPEAIIDLGANGGIEEEIERLISAIEALYIGSSAPTTIISKFNPEKHCLSGDWIARRHMIVERQIDGVDEVVADDGVRSRREAARVTSFVSEDEPQITEEGVVRQEEQPGNGELSATQEATTVWEEERSVEPEIALETRPNESSSAARSNDEGQPQMALPVESTATPTCSSQQPVLTSTTNEELPERRSKHGNPIDEKGKIRIWSLRTGRNKGKPQADVNSIPRPTSQQDLPPLPPTNSPLLRSSSSSSASSNIPIPSEPHPALPPSLQQRVSQVVSTAPSTPSSSNTPVQAPTSSTPIDQYIMGKSRYGNPRDENGGVRIWSMKSVRR